MAVADKKIGPWRRLNSQSVYDNPWIEVFHDKVLTPGQTQGIYGRVHFKSKAIAIVPIDDEGCTYLVGQHRYPLDAYSWELPMGGCSSDEEALVAAKRELREETGFTAGHWQQIQRIHTSNSITDEEGVVFVATDLSAGEQALEVTEDISVKRLPLAEAIQWALDGRISDVISVAALLYLAATQ